MGAEKKKALLADATKITDLFKQFAGDGEDSGEEAETSKKSE